MDILKKLRISDKTGISLNNKDVKIPFILLTHNELLFNLAFSNSVFRNNSAFQLSSNKNSHKISKLKNVITPHFSHLKHVKKVSEEDADASFHTANSIRCVLEGIWKFYSPDLKDFSEFLQIIETEEIVIKSSFIHTLSHGGNFYDSSQFDSDLVEAAIETINIVEKFAPGQLKQVA